MAGSLKCNTDAELFSDVHAAGYGWVLRYSHGVMRAYSMDKMKGLDSVRECEAIGLAEAMLWVYEAGYTNVVFESDAKVVVDAVKSNEEDRTEFGSIIGQCQSLLRQQTAFSVGYVKRQVNEVAHVLARRSHFSSCRVVSFAIPSFLVSPLMNTCLDICR